MLFLFEVPEYFLPFVFLANAHCVPGGLSSLLPFASHFLCFV
jgi:hypothetical protein